MRILFVGDSHTNLGWWQRNVAPAIERHRPAVVVSVGDFGYWPSHDEGRRFLDQVGRSALSAESTIVFVDGNHEEHDALPPPGDRPLTTVAPRVAHAHRGARWTWDGVRFGALGGAVSPDRAERTPGWDWFPQEATTDHDVERLGSEPLDVLLTHDAPATVSLQSRLSLPADVDRDATANRLRIATAAAATRPAVLVHGHWHLAHRTRLLDADGGALVVGLAADSATDPRRSMWLAETTDLVRGASG